MNQREQLIEKAAEAITFTTDHPAMGHVDWPNLADAVEIVKVVLAVFEEPQGEPSETFHSYAFPAHIVRDHVRNLTGASDAELDALGGFTGEPGRDALTEAISDAFYGNHYDPSGHAADAVLSMIRATVQGEPTDAQVIAALDAYRGYYRENDGPGDPSLSAMRAAIRAAAAVQGGER